MGEIESKVVGERVGSHARKICREVELPPVPIVGLLSG